MDPYRGSYMDLCVDPRWILHEFLWGPYMDPYMDPYVDPIWIPVGILYRSLHEC